jgi:hypothetical protein
MSLVSYAILEASTLVLFGLTLWHAWRRGRGPLLELIMAAGYGILLEWGDILIFRTYHYSPLFFLAVGPVPIVIGLCWGMLIYGAMAYTDQLGLPAWAAPWADALWAILLDLAFDAVAIRLQLWTWTVPMSAGYFGVPADNFWAWIWVALSFSAYIRWVRARRTSALQTVLLFVSPVAAFAGLLFGILVFNVLVAVVYRERFVPGDGLLLFLGLLLVCAVITGTAVWRRRKQIQPGIDLIPTTVRWAMHGYFLLWAIFLFLVPRQRLPGMDMPVFLVVVALVLAALEIGLVLLVARRKRPLLQQIVLLPAKRALDARQC